MAANHTYTHPRRRRAAHEKSKNGCLTCRIRKVKCDETRPHCRKCTDSGRKCEGPMPVPAQFRFIQERTADRTAVSKALAGGLRREISLVAPQHDQDERRAFYFFLHRAAPVFAGVVEASFWLDLVPRLAQSSPVVWDTVVSISWLFERVPYDVLVTNFEPRPASIVSPDHGRAVKWYNRAIATLRQQIERRGIDTALALLSCILFISVEFQQRNIGNALNLVETGYKLMGQSLSVSSTTPRPSANSLAIHEIVTPFFWRHTMLMATLGAPRPPDWSYHLGESTLKSSALASLSLLDQPKGQLYSLMYQAYEIIRVEDLKPTEDHIIKRQRLRQKLVLEDLIQWETAFVNAWSYDMRPEIVGTASSLLMYWGVCYIWLSTCTIPLQTAFDEYSAQFATILDHADTVLTYSVDSTTGRPVFGFEAGFIPPVYFCAIKCRVPLLRRRALALLRRSPSRDCLWASVATEKVIEKVIALEEGDDSASLIEKTGPVPLPPEDKRIHHIAVVGKDVLGGTQRLALQLSKYVAKPPDTSRRMVNENIWLEESPDQQS